MTARRIAALVAAAAVLGTGSIAAAPALGSPYVHAHRGGSISEGVPVTGENTMAAFRRSAALGFVLELDVKLTADGVPVVIHDPELDRTTDCTGLVVDKTAAQLAACRVDILGTSGNKIDLPPGDPRLEPVPTLAEFLVFARDAGATINLEIKNVVIDPDYDPTDAFANTVLDEILASGFPASRLIVQSFWPPDLAVVEARTPQFDTSLLTLPEFNTVGPAGADTEGNEWFSPSWPLSGELIAEAHNLGEQVVPYTIDDDAGIADAFDAGVDAIITNDPERARSVVSAREGAPPPIPPPPSASRCAEVQASRTVAPIESLDAAPGAPRVFAIQFKQELRHVVTYQDFRDKIECLVRSWVVPKLASQRPNVIALTEDVGLMTIATGSRGAAAREQFGSPDAPGCESQGAPCGAVGALGAVTAAYAPQVGAYGTRFGIAGQPVSSGFLAATDTFGRGWMQVFSDIAHRYDVYILGSNNQARFRESRDPTEIALFADPDLPPPDSVYVATKPAVYNEVFMWGPTDVRREGPRPLRNVVASNRKVPLTPIEEQLQLSPGPSTGPDAVENLRPFQIPGTQARVGFATSKPAFEYDQDSQASFGVPLAGGIDPCSDTAVYYMRCLDRLGTNLVIQDEANSGRWAGPSGEGHYQPLEWMRSTWRATADPTVGFDYNVTPHMVGNLADLPFDGQTAITQRGLDGTARCNYVGNSSFQGDPPELDPESLRVYAGPKPEFVAIAPWVVPDGPRPDLRASAAALAPGSGDALENDYVETAVVADLSFPPNPRRAGCGGTVRAGRCANTVTGTPGADRLAGTADGDRIFALAGSDRAKGRGGDDCIKGQRGADRLFGGGGSDTLLGGPHADVLGGGSGPDRVAGGFGPDRIFGGPGRDLLVGGPGHDRIDARRGGRDVVRCGRGRDLVLADRGDRVARDCERVRRQL